MTWEENLNLDFTITTGDGEIYKPLWRGASKEKEFNTSNFEFINVYGTLVDRKQPQGRRFDLVFYFQGSDNLEQCQNFENSCDDPRQWIIKHPYYGEIKGQPLSIKFDDKDLNITEITVPFWESISPDFPFSNFSKKDNTRNQHKQIMLSMSIAGVTGVEFAPADISNQTEALGVMGAELQNLQTSNTYSDFQNALNSGLQAIDNLLSEPLNALQTVQNFLDLPATYEQAIKGRVASYENIYFNLKNSIETVADKKYYEAMGGTILSLISVVLVTPITGDYILVSDVYNLVNKLAFLKDDYQNTLDELSSSVYEVNAPYTPDAEAQTQLDELLNYVIATLYTYTFGAKKEYIVNISKDTNIILLTHRYLGLDENDENIDTMIKTNNLLLNQKFLVKKGQQIKYVK